MDLSDKIVWWVLAAALFSAVIIGLVKLGDIIVKRRTASMLAAYGDEKEEPSPKE